MSPCALVSCGVLCLYDLSNPFFYVCVYPCACVVVVVINGQLLVSSTLARWGISVATAVTFIFPDRAVTNGTHS